MNLLDRPEYAFLRTDPRLGRNVIFLTYGGSYAYGTNVEGSDIDIRGCTLNSKADLLGMGSFEQVVDDHTDTTVYGFNKLLGLRINCNPNTIELLGCKPEHYFVLTPIGKQLIDQRKMFLSRRAINSFGGYAGQQLRRLENALTHDAYPTEVKERHILQTLNGAGFEAYLVGGCVRDLLRGVEPHDWDICTSALPEETEACFAGQRIIETGLKHGTVTVLEGGEPYEITAYRTEGPYSDSRRPDFVRFVPNLEKDLARRDFTMNAIAMDLGGNLHDPFGGTEDIKAGIIRCVGEPGQRFQEDGLRVMRALRFAAVFGYEIEERTARAIHENRAMLDRVAVERINVELCKLLTGSNVGSILRQHPNVLCEFWSELGPLVTLEQNNSWHCWGGWEHTIHAVEASPADVTLRLTMLLHDIGKPSCKSTDEHGIDHFYGHPAVSAQMADQMLRALKFDNKTRERVVLLVERHDAQLPPRSQVIRKWLNRLGPEAFFQLLEVKRADNMGQAPGKVQDRMAELDEIRAKAEQILAERQCLTLKDLAIDGRDVMTAGVAPGPGVGRILEDLLERVLSGEIPNEREILFKLISSPHSRE